MLFKGTRERNTSVAKMVSSLALRVSGKSLVKGRATLLCVRNLYYGVVFAVTTGTFFGRRPKLIPYIQTGDQRSATKPSGTRMRGQKAVLTRTLCLGRREVTLLASNHDARSQKSTVQSRAIADIRLSRSLSLLEMLSIFPYWQQCG